MSGVKYDGGKEPLALISREALLAEARVLAFGAKKYAADNWRGGMEYRRLGSAAMRHLLAWLDGEDTDPETGESHLAHLRCCAGFLIEYQKYGLGTDDRFKRVIEDVPEFIPPPRRPGARFRVGDEVEAKSDFGPFLRGHTCRVIEVEPAPADSAEPTSFLLTLATEDGIAYEGQWYESLFDLPVPF